MKVFITGGTGYIGGRLVAALLKRGDRVQLLTRCLKNPEAAVANNVQICFGDLLNPSSLKAGMDGCDAVIHLAGYAKNWAANPMTYYYVNVRGTRYVLEAALQAGVKKVVCASSIVVFGPSNN